MKLLDFFNYYTKCVLCNSRMSSVFDTSDGKEVDINYGRTELKVYDSNSIPEFITVKFESLNAAFVVDLETNEFKIINLKTKTLIRDVFEVCAFSPTGMLLNYCSNCSGFRYFSDIMKFDLLTGFVTPVELYTESFELNDDKSTYVFVNRYRDNPQSWIEIYPILEEGTPSSFMDDIQSIDIPFTKLSKLNFSDLDKLLARLKSFVILA